MIGNPGMPYTVESYLAAADTLVIFEGTDTVMLISARSSSRRGLQTTRRTIRQHRLRRDVEHRPGSSVRQGPPSHAGSFYITDGELPNPYRGLPPYWLQEVAAG